MSTLCTAAYGGMIHEEAVSEFAVFTAVTQTHTGLRYCTYYTGLPLAFTNSSHSSDETKKKSPSREFPVIAAFMNLFRMCYFPVLKNQNKSRSLL